jgi:hypothetical protein
MTPQDNETHLDGPRLPHSLGHASLTIGSDVWELYIFGVTRIGRDAFIQLTLLGPRECTVTVRAPSALVRGVTARQLLDAVCDWLISGDPSDRAYLELAGVGRHPF